MTTPSWSIRLAGEADIAELETLIALSARELQSGYYSEDQLDAAIGTVFGVDRQLIRDGTYYVAESGEMLVGCGGWSRRRTLYGGDRGRVGEDATIDPATEPARIRAFFVRPGWERQGIGRRLLEICETALRAAGFSRAEMMATLAGEPLYLASGYGEIERVERVLPGGGLMPMVRMGKQFQR